MRSCPRSDTRALSGTTYLLRTIAERFEDDEAERLDARGCGVRLWKPASSEICSTSSGEAAGLSGPVLGAKPLISSLSLNGLGRDEVIRRPPPAHCQLAADASSASRWLRPR